jgi:hypothetical protein
MPMKRRQPVFALAVLAILELSAGGCDHDDSTRPEWPMVDLQSVDVHGSGTSGIGALEFVQSVGTCEIDGTTISAIIYDIVPWPSRGLTILNIVAPTPDDLHVLFLYCSEDTLTDVWHESYADPLTSYRAQGEVAFGGRITAVRPRLERIATLPDSEQLVAGFVMEGTDIHYAGDVGSISILDSTYELRPFEMVDCSDCGGDGRSGWYELHSMIGTPGTDLGFGILYLFTDRQDRAYLNYYIHLGPVRLGESPTLTAEWILPVNIPSPKAGWMGLPAP